MTFKYYFNSKIIEDFNQDRLDWVSKKIEREHSAHEFVRLCDSAGLAFIDSATLPTTSSFGIGSFSSQISLQCLEKVNSILHVSRLKIVQLRFCGHMSLSARMTPCCATNCHSLRWWSQVPPVAVFILLLELLLLYLVHRCKILQIKVAQRYLARSIVNKTFYDNREAAASCAGLMEPRIPSVGTLLLFYDLGCTRNDLCTALPPSRLWD